jgi:hypothetical protein
VKNNDYRSPIIALCLALFASVTAFAQSEKIAIKMVPEPNQTVRTRLIQDLEMDMNFEGEASSSEPLPGPMKMIARTVFALTQRVGEADKEGNITSEMTYDELSYETTVNGQPTQDGSATRKFVGQKIVVTFNKQGELIDLKMPSTMELPKDAFKQMLNSFYGSLPKTPIGVGESAMTSSGVTVLLPIAGAPPLEMDAQVKSTLVSVEKDVAGRLAKFDQIMDGKLVSDVKIPGQNGQFKMSLDLMLNGGGGLVLDIGKGVLRSSDSSVTFGGKIRMTDDPNGTKSPTLNLQGTMKITITGGGGSN